MKNKSIKYKLISMLLFMTVFLFSCQSDDDDNTESQLMGSWQLVSQSKDGSEIVLATCEQQELLYFASQNVCYTHSACKDRTTRSSWNYTSGSKILNIADFLPITYYVEIVDNNNNSLVIRYYTYSSQGAIEKNMKQYKSVETAIVDGKLQLK